MNAPPSPDAAPLFEVDSLSGAHFGPLSFRLDAGECLAVSGPSGAGKSLLLRALADLDESEGTVRLGGVERSRIAPPEWRRRVALMPAEPAWWSDRIGEHFPELPSEGLASLGLTDAAMDWSVSRASSGERQRLALLRVLANRPEVLLLDEATANLDTENTERVERLVREYLAQTGAAALWVSHDPAQRKRIAERALRLEDGRLREAAA
jgi:ABC-type iron transport system FetAB ATPase subunit